MCEWKNSNNPSRMKFKLKASARKGVFMKSLQKAPAKAFCFPGDMLFCKNQIRNVAKAKTNSAKQNKLYEYCTIIVLVLNFSQGAEGNWSIFFIFKSAFNFTLFPFTPLWIIRLFLEPIFPKSDAYTYYDQSTLFLVRDLILPLSVIKLHSIYKILFEIAFIIYLEIHKGTACLLAEA